MGMVMVKCPHTGRAIATGMKTDRESFQRCTVFFGRTHCPICHAYHDWFAREAWVHEPSEGTRLSAAPRPDRSSMIAMEEHHGAHANPN
jgi:hypothetical protein